MEQKKKDYSKYRKKYWREQIKHRGVQFLGGVCRNCGGAFEDCCYDFHHLNPKEKDFTIGNVQTNGAKSWFKVRDELKKCVLLCANCHRLAHAGLIETDLQLYFNDEYYEWDLTKFKLIDSSTGLPKDANITCPICGQYKSPNANKCSECAMKEQIRFEVSREELKEMIYTMAFTDIGKKYGVSDNSIRKRCEKFGLPSYKKDILKYSPEEWASI